MYYDNTQLEGAGVFPDKGILVVSDHWLNLTHFRATGPKLVLSISVISSYTVLLYMATDCTRCYNPINCFSGSSNVGMSGLFYTVP